MRLMAWLGKGVSVNSGYWAAAALQHAMMFYKVCLRTNAILVSFIGHITGMPLVIQAYIA